MAKFQGKYKYFFIAILLFFIAFFVDKKFSKPEKTKINIQHFQKVLHKKEKKIRQITDSLANVADTGKFEFSQKPLFTDKQLRHLDNKGFTILIYRNDSLIFWSDNHFDAGKIYNPEKFNPGCNKIGSFWLDIYQNQTGNYRFIGIFRIKEKYKLKNHYLENSFNKDLQLPDNVSISLIPLSYGIDIKDLNGNYLLSLIPTNQAIAKENSTWFIDSLYLLSILVFFVFIHFLFNSFEAKSLNSRVLVGLLIITVLKILMSKLHIPLLLFSKDIFDSTYLFNSVLGDSQGDLFLNLLIILLSVFHLFKISRKTYFFKHKTAAILSIVSAFFVLFGSIFYINKFLHTALIPLDIYNILNLNHLSFLAFFNIAIFSGISIYILVKLLAISYKNLSLKYCILISTLSLAAGFALSIFILKDITLSYAVLIILILILICWAIYRKALSSLQFYFAVTFVSALFISIMLISSLKTNQLIRNKELIVKLSNQRDDVAEALLKHIIKKMPDDPTLSDYLLMPGKNNVEIINYLKRRYFTSYWNKYNIKVNICKNDNCPISLTQQQRQESWIFDRVFFVKTPSAQTFYLLQYPFTIKNDTLTLQIILSPRIYPSNVGYPQLLLNEDVDLKKIDYSFAKYQNNKLTSKTGDYNYPIDGQKLFANNEIFKTIDDGKLTHLVYTINKGNYVVLTYKKIRFIHLIITFAYIFLLFVILLVLTTIILNINKLLNTKNFSFRTKLIFSLLTVLTLSFVLIGVVTMLFNISQLNENHRKEAIKKLQDLNIYFEQKYKNENFSQISDDKLNSDLSFIAEVFGVDINLYSPQGFLLATSRPEIYTFGIVSNRISAIAKYKIDYDYLVQFLINERISLMKYISAYARLTEGNKTKAILNIPYFTNPDAIKKDISNLLISITNIYVVLFVITLILAVLLSEQIISPLRIIQKKIQKLELGKKYEKIEYSRKDEIGELINEYNKMVDKLDESIKKLQKSERENAWRDMAKQIAHEIKNPLTPMKLSIQLLMRSWENQDTDFDERLRNTSETLITQIDTLRRIAEEFSEFAKMPKPQEQEINLADKIEEICKLYENTQNVEVTAELVNYREAVVLADDKQLTRALINLIKNAIQAIPKGIKGKIILRLDVFGNKAIIKVIDNGTGIPDEIKDKLFTPSFTTKSSGMGLGLTMVKNIIENAHGKISFTSEKGKGTTFIIELPLHKK